MTSEAATHHTDHHAGDLPVLELRSDAAGSADSANTGDGRADDSARRAGGRTRDVQAFQRPLTAEARGAILWLYGSVAEVERALGLTHGSVHGMTIEAHDVIMSHLEALRRERDTGLLACIAAVQSLSSVEDLLPRGAETAAAREQLALSKARLLSRYIEPLQGLV